MALHQSFPQLQTGLSRRFQPGSQSRVNKSQVETAMQPICRWKYRVKTSLIVSNVVKALLNSSLIERVMLSGSRGFRKATVIPLGGREAINDQLP